MSGDVSGSVSDCQAAKSEEVHRRGYAPGNLWLCTQFRKQTWEESEGDYKKADQEHSPKQYEFQTCSLRRSTLPARDSYNQARETSEGDGDLRDDEQEVIGHSKRSSPLPNGLSFSGWATG